MDIFKNLNYKSSADWKYRCSEDEEVASSFKRVGNSKE